MYAPAQFQERRTEVLLAALREIKLAALVTPQGEDIHVTHVPMSVTEDAGVVLEAHVARGNPHHVAAANGARSVAIFQGPHAYVSPSWYPSKQETGEVVPTWNYITVHVHGVLEAVEDPAWLSAQVRALTDANERGRDDPWSVDDAPAAYIEIMLAGIVGLRLRASRLEGAWKLQQHRSPADRRGLISGLSSELDPQARRIGALMETLEDERSRLRRK